MPHNSLTEESHSISPHQWRSGIAAWLGWMFDGLDMHLYTLVATPFVAQLMMVTSLNDPAVGFHASIIQGAFLVGWALGGAVFGRIGDKLGRSRTLCLTILTYALFTGLSFFATRWWHLLAFRFLSALGIGGEWAVGASLLSETWPKRWRPWIAAVLQTGVNVGILVAIFAHSMLRGYPERTVFLVGIVPALLVLWIRRAVPEPEEWHAAKKASKNNEPTIGDLFRGDIRKITLLVVSVCAVSLTAHWAFMFWHQVHIRNLPDVVGLSGPAKNAIADRALFLVISSSILGNFLGGYLATLFGYRRTIAAMCLGYFVSMYFLYRAPMPVDRLLWFLVFPGVFQGVFGLFTMCLPPLFPTLLRTTGAGFCYNIGRIFAAMGTVIFGLVSYHSASLHTGAPLDYRQTLFYSGLLFLPAAFIAWYLPERDWVEKQTANIPLR